MSSSTVDQPVPRIHWRLAGGAVVAHLVLFSVSLGVSGAPTIHPGQEGIEHSFNAGSLPRVLAGLFVVLVAELLLLPVFVFMSGALGRRTPGGRIAAITGALAGVGSILMIIGVGLPAGAAALWGLDRGLDLPTAIALNNVRNFVYLAVLPVMGLTSLGFGLAALGDRVLTRWVGWGGVAVGILLLAALPFAALGLSYGMPLWLLWWAGTGVALVRHGLRRSVGGKSGATARTSPMMHA